MSTVERLRAAGAEIEKLQLQPGDVLVLRGFARPGDGLTLGGDSLDPVDVIGQFLVDHEIPGVLLVVVPEGGDLARMDPAEMAAAGWVRAE